MGSYQRQNINAAQTIIITLSKTIKSLILIRLFVFQTETRD